MTRQTLIDRATTMSATPRRSTCTSSGSGRKSSPPPTRRSASSRSGVWATSSAPEPVVGRSLGCRNASLGGSDVGVAPACRSQPGPIRRRPARRWPPARGEGAGSGKTQLTYRIAHLIEGGLSPFEILAITFTNKAAGEMKHRAGGYFVGRWRRRCGSRPSTQRVRILRRDVERLGFPPLIYDQADAVRLVGYVIRDLNLDPKRFPPRSVHGTISMAKNENVGPSQFTEQAEQIFQRKIGEVYVEYQKRLLQAGAMDFDDL